MEQRRQAMNSKEYNKKIADARRNESRKFGFRQSSYINFKVEAGYFFCLYFLTEEARLTVKPMYADELWWDIWNATENKNEPLSLRGTGAYSLSGQVLASYKIAETTDDSKLADMFEAVFHAATADILQMRICRAIHLTSWNWRKMRFTPDMAGNL